MANDYMAKLAADIEGMSMMREPEPMPIIYRQEGGDTYGEETADISGSFDDGPSDGGANEGGADDGTYTADQMASLVETLGPDIQGPAGEQVGIGPAGDGPMSPETRGLLEGIYNLAPGTLDFRFGVGRGDPEGPGEFTGIDSPTSKNVNDIIDTMPSWLVPYYNAEKAKGKTNAETVAALQQALSIPGGAARMASGYSDGYSFGGPGGTMQDVIDNYMSDASVAIKAAQKKQEKEEAEIVKDEEAGYEDMPTDYFGSIVDTVSDFFGGPSKEDEIMMGQAVKDAGFTFDPMSQAEKNVGLGLSYLAPNPIGFVKGIGDALAFATDSRVLGNVDTPYGTFQLTESGDLQTTDFMGTPDDSGNEPAITRKRKIATEKTDDEKDVTEDVNKPGFPQQTLPRLTPSDRATLEKILGPDNPILDKYSTGIQALV